MCRASSRCSSLIFAAARSRPSVTTAIRKTNEGGLLRHGAVPAPRHCSTSWQTRSCPERFRTSPPHTCCWSIASLPPRDVRRHGKAEHGEGPRRESTSSALRVRRWARTRARRSCSPSRARRHADAAGDSEVCCSSTPNIKRRERRRRRADRRA